jgi:DNA modification methylase
MIRNRIVETKRVKASTLLNHPSNWRVHPTKQKNALQGAVDDLGQVQAVTVRKTKKGLQLVDGHLRKELFGDQMITVNVTDLDDDEAKKALLTLDPLAAMAGRNSEALEKLMASVSFDNADLQKMLEQMGKSIAHPGLTDANDLPDSPVRVKAGEVWKLGAHRLFVGSCEKLPLKHKSVDLLVTDPPYGVSYANKNRFLNAIAPANRIQKPIADDHHSAEEMEKLWTTWFTSLRPLMRDGASYYVTGPQGGDLLLLLLSLRASGFPLRHMLVWAKNNHVLGRCDYHYRHEPIIFGWVDGSHHKVANKSETSLWEIDKPHKSDLHPTMKPVELYVRAINNSTDPGDTVLDAFMGSGTCLIACEQTGRKAVGSETDLGYASVCITRWELFTGKKAKRLG